MITLIGDDPETPGLPALQQDIVATAIRAAAELVRRMLRTGS